MQSCFSFQRRKTSVREEGYLPAARWRHPLRPRLFRPAGLTAATFTCLLGHGKLFTLQHLNKTGRLWKDSRKAFQVWLEEHCGGGADRFQEPGVENSWISRLAGALCSQTQSSCGSLPKTCMRSSQAAFSHGWGRGSWVPPPHLRNYWELMVAGKRQSSFVSPALVDGSASMHIWAALMRHIKSIKTVRRGVCSWEGTLGMERYAVRRGHHPCVKSVQLGGVTLCGRLSSREGTWCVEGCIRRSFRGNRNG